MLDYSKLLGRIKEKDYTQKSLASEIGISESQLCLKLKGNYPFKQSDIQKICACLEIDPKDIGIYFFTQKLEESQGAGAE